MGIGEWVLRAACRDTDVDLFAQTASEQKRARDAVCRDCPVRLECLADALDNQIEFGVWGGMTERERRALLRRRGLVTGTARTRAPGVPPGESRSAGRYLAHRRAATGRLWR